MEILIKMRDIIKKFIKICAETLPIIEPIYEFGGAKVSGRQDFDIKNLFPNKKFFSSDIKICPEVDTVLDLHNLNLPSGSVGTAIVLDTFEHLEYPRKAISEIYRVLKTNGVLIMSSTMDFPIHNYPYDYWRYTPEAFLSLLKLFVPKFVESVGKEDFPHTVIGVGSKRMGKIYHVYDNIFFDKIKKWKKHNSVPLINDLKNNPLIMITPPIFLRIYNILKNKKSFLRV